MFMRRVFASSFDWVVGLLQFFAIGQSEMRSNEMIQSKLEKVKTCKRH